MSLIILHCRFLFELMLILKGEVYLKKQKEKMILSFSIGDVH